MPGSHDESAVEFAWRTHAAQEAWTAKVDVKASILLALVGGALFATVTAHGPGGVLVGARGWPVRFEAVGVALELLAMLSAAIAVFPLLGRTRDHLIQAEKGSFIYFGHARHREASELSEQLASLSSSDQRLMLSEQVIAMAQRNWKKHRYLQGALILSLSGIAFLTLGAISVD